MVVYTLLLAMPRCSPCTLATSPAHLSFAPQGPESLGPSSPPSSCPQPNLLLETTKCIQPPSDPSLSLGCVGIERAKEVTKSTNVRKLEWFQESHKILAVPDYSYGHFERVNYIIIFIQHIGRVRTILLFIVRSRL